MILRRVIAHFRKQEWTAIALDFLIVVVGVFIGIQVSNWNAARVDQGRIERRLSDLATDLRADRAEIAVVINTAEWRLSAIEAVLAAAGYPVPREVATPQFGTIAAPALPPLPHASVRSANYAIFALSTFDGTQRTYDSLVSTGDFQLLRDAQLARDIQAYYRAVTEILDFEQRHSRLSERLMATRGRAGVVFGTTYEELARKVREHPQFASDLEIVWMQGVLEIARVGMIDREAGRLIAAIEGDDK